MTEASSFYDLLVNFSQMFTAPTFRNFTALACGWVLCTGRRTISRVIQLGGFSEERRHHSDTLCRKSGAHIWGGGMHHDALLSNYGRGKSMVKHFSFGHNWVIVCVCLSTPWNKDRWMAIPIAFRLYRAKKRCPPKQYRKRTVIAREMMKEIIEWIPKERVVSLVGDTEYACRELGRSRTKSVGQKPHRALPHSF
jgi:hypothetical protein